MTLYKFPVENKVKKVEEDEYQISKFDPKVVHLKEGRYTLGENIFYSVEEAKNKRIKGAEKYYVYLLKQIMKYREKIEKYQNEELEVYETK